VKDQNPIRTARRRTRQVNRLGTDSPICFRCGCAEVALLKKVSRRFLEDHHIVGEAHDPDLTEFLCRNCHYLATENLLQAGVSMFPEPDPVKRIANELRALSVHHQTLADKHNRMANELEALPVRKANS
jgi:hypothetical protein